MEICYYWTENLGENILNQGYDFGSELSFTFNYNDRELVIKENELYIKNFFNLYSDEKIKNITAIVGRNGVGKSSFLEAIKSLFIEGGILAYKDYEGKLYNHKRILILKNDERYEIIYHQDLLSKLKGSNIRSSYNNTDNLNIKFVGKNLINKYKFNYEVYGKDKEFYSKQANIFRIKGNKDLEETKCIYFSNKFDNNPYVGRTIAESNYYDLSTKGILNELDNKLESKYFRNSPELDYFNYGDYDFDIGFLREYYASENEKRIQLLSSDEGKNFITKHQYFPKKAYLNLDYILRRQESSTLFSGNKTKKLLRVERDEESITKVERIIYDVIEKMYNPKSDSDDLLLARQTYLRRILDLYFEGVETYLNNSGCKDYFFKTVSTTTEMELFGTKNIYLLINRFSRIAIRTLIEFSEDNNIDTDPSIIEIFRLNSKYIAFITFFDDAFLSGNSLINIIKGVTYLNTNKNTEDENTEDENTEDENHQQNSRQIRVGLIELNLSQRGLALLGEFLDNYKSLGAISDFIKIDWESISTGEDALLGMYSRFYALGEKLREDFSEDKENKKESLVILLDEAEHSLHPEWQRTILNNLIEFLPLVFPTFETIQVILATNIPFIVADIPTNNIIYLEKIKGKVRIVDKPEQTFAANIHNLLMNNFFMDSTIGKFSEQKIKHLVQNLRINENNNGVNNAKTTSNERLYSKQEIRRTIETIGEPVIKNKLESMYVQKFGKDSNENAMKKLLSEVLETGKDIPEDVKERIRGALGMKNEGLESD